MNKKEIVDMYYRGARELISSCYDTLTMPMEHSVSLVIKMDFGNDFRSPIIISTAAYLNGKMLDIVDCYLKDANQYLWRNIAYIVDRVVDG